MDFDARAEATRKKLGLQYCVVCDFSYATEHFQRHLQSKGHARKAAKKYPAK